MICLFLLKFLQRFKGMIVKNTGLSENYIGLGVFSLLLFIDNFVANILVFLSL